MKHKTMTWYLFRHALATYSTQGYGEEILTASILPEAIPSIEKLAQHLNSVSKSLNLRSELARCEQTTDIITKITGKVFVPDKRLNEFYRETYDALRKRIWNFVDEMFQTKRENLLLCTHGIVIAAIKHILLAGDFSEKHLLDYPACGELLIIKDKKEEVISFNDS